jgi:hypothetical protein
MGTITPSLDLSDGLDAVDLMTAVDAVDERLVAVVLPLIADAPDIKEAEECEMGPI